jgi:hypothetical protein
MAKFLFQELITAGDKITTRLGAGTLTASAANVRTDKEIGKAVKLVGDSRYDLCGVGDAIEAFCVAVQGATLDDYSIGTVQLSGRKEVLADGLQATPGTGAIAIGDYVLASTQVAAGTALADTSSQKVVKATFQPFSAEAAALTDVNDMVKAATWAWRVVSLGSAGTGAVGTKILIERVK